MNDLDVVHALSENSSGESKLVKPNFQVLFGDSWSANAVTTICSVVLVEVKILTTKVQH